MRTASAGKHLSPRGDYVIEDVVSRDFAVIYLVHMGNFP